MLHYPQAAILITDDFKDWRSQVQTILQARPEWTIVSEAENGADAVQKAMQLQPDIILLDIGLPILNGIEAARLIRQRCPRTRIVFVTQNTDREIKEAAMEAGASGYIIKVHASRDLLDTVAAALGSIPGPPPA